MSQSTNAVHHHACAETQPRDHSRLRLYKIRCSVSVASLNLTSCCKPAGKHERMYWAGSYVRIPTLKKLGPVQPSSPRQRPPGRSLYRFLHVDYKCDGFQQLGHVSGSPVSRVIEFDRQCCRPLSIKSPLLWESCGDCYIDPFTRSRLSTPERRKQELGTHMCDTLNPELC